MTANGTTTSPNRLTHEGSRGRELGVAGGALACEVPPTCWMVGGAQDDLEDGGPDEGATMPQYREMTLLQPPSLMTSGSVESTGFGIRPALVPSPLQSPCAWMM
eukprot:5783116-Amphidinium_carterae.1